MKTSFFTNLLSSFDQNNTRVNIKVYDSAYKYTSICIWYLDNTLNISNLYDYVFELDRIKKDNNDLKVYPKLLFESNSYFKIHNILCATKLGDYRSIIEALGEIVDNEKTDEYTLKLS